ncbi:MAG: SUF system Fe-S cluster assembly protein [Calditrichaeota bacterium]|nr:MAG: SUF system Fe-S cluster assembly protein [Calditrichota bacterium]
MEEKSITREQVVDALKTVYDPEIPVDIYELGLIYDIRIKDDKVFIQMTLTTPNCPSAQSLPLEVKDRVSRIPGVKDVEVEIVWDPPWGMEMMSEEARLELGYF